MPSSRNVCEPGLRRRLAGRPGLAQSAGPVRPRRLETASLRGCRWRWPAPARSVFGAGSGFGGSPSACTRFQNGVKTRKPRPSLLRIARGRTSRSPGKLCEAMPIARGRRRPARPRPDAAPARSRSRTPRRRRSRAPASAMISAAGPLRSTSGAPIARGSVCRARSDCASHQRAAPPSGRAAAARLVSSST